MGIKDWNTLRKVALQGYGDRILCVGMMGAVSKETVLPLPGHCSNLTQATRHICW